MLTGKERRILENYIIIGILLVVIAFAVIRTKKHFRGGGCCGSGSTTVRSKKKLEGPKLGEKMLTVEGMHCENCAVRVENALNRLDGVVCRVNLKKKTAVVSYSVEVSDDALKETVERLGYQVTGIR
ncbi:MAG: heavy-metal-associated domain-containing protein [Oscillospiraceae bacterium]|nr:heavy-metal-associated domain-containing protein [Oscillospiraceae bacterium]